MKTAAASSKPPLLANSIVLSWLSYPSSHPQSPKKNVAGGTGIQKCVVGHIKGSSKTKGPHENTARSPTPRQVSLKHEALFPELRKLQLLFTFHKCTVNTAHGFDQVCAVL